MAQSQASSNSTAKFRRKSKKYKRFFLEDETLVYVYKSLKIAQVLGLCPLVPRKGTRSVGLNKSLLFSIQSVIHTVVCYGAMYLVSTCLSITTYLTFRKKVLPFSFWIFWVGFMIFVFVLTMVDHLFREHAGVLQNIFNSGMRILDIVEGNNCS